jgi:hypothetical protein
VSILTQFARSRATAVPAAVVKIDDRDAQAAAADLDRDALAVALGVMTQRTAARAA